MKIKVMLAAAVIAAVGFVACEKTSEMNLTSKDKLNKNLIVNHDLKMKYAVGDVNYQISATQTKNRLKW
jgi:hypothetical protein